MAVSGKRDTERERERERGREREVDRDREISDECLGIPMSHCGRTTREQLVKSFGHIEAGT
jgi:hypothetical protein